MDLNLYNLLIQSGQSEEKARELASQYVRKDTVKLPAKRSLINYVNSVQGTKERLQLAVSIMQVLGVESNADMVMQLQEFNAEPVELLRRFSAILESKWIPQKKTKGNDNLQQVANELQGIIDEPVATVGDDDPLLMAVQNELANNIVRVPDLDTDEEEEELEDTDIDEFGNGLDGEEDEPIIVHRGTPIAPTFPPM